MFVFLHFFKEKNALEPWSESHSQLKHEGKTIRNHKEHSSFQQNQTRCQRLGKKLLFYFSDKVFLESI